MLVTSILFFLRIPCVEQRLPLKKVKQILTLIFLHLRSYTKLGPRVIVQPMEAQVAWRAIFQKSFTAWDRPWRRHTKMSYT